MKEWEKHRDEMVQLYQVHKLGRVMEIMTQRHNFHAWYAKKQVLFFKKKTPCLDYSPSRFLYTPKNPQPAPRTLWLAGEGRPYN